MIYREFPYNDIARQVELQIADLMVEASELSPKKRDVFYSSIFEQVAQSLDIVDALDEMVVYTNINPVKVLLNRGLASVISKVCKDPIPLSGDGFLLAKMSYEDKLASGQYDYAIRGNLKPTSDHSIANLGSNSSLFNIDNKRDMGHYLSSYCSSMSFNYRQASGMTSSELRQAVDDFLRGEDARFKNVRVWADNAVGLSQLSEALIERTGILTAFHKNKSIINPSMKIDFDVLLSIMNDKDIGYNLKSKLFMASGFRGENLEIKKEMFSNLRDLSLWFYEHAGKGGKYMLGDMIEDIARSHILAQNTSTDIKSEIKIAMDGVDLSDKVRPSKMKFIMDYLERPELISKLRSSAKRSMIEECLGI